MKPVDVTAKFKKAPKALINQRPPKAEPSLPPPPPGFEVKAVGDPKPASNGDITQLLQVFRNGKPAKLVYTMVVATKTATGYEWRTKADLDADKAATLADATALLLAEEALIAQAKALVEA